MIPLYCRRSDSGEHVTQPGWRLVEAAAVAASLLLNGCSVERDESTSTSAATTSTVPVVEAGTFTRGECPPGVLATPPSTVSCGTLEVPENRNVPDEASVVLPIDHRASGRSQPAGPRLLP